MTFRHLEIFMSVYQNQSITKASKELHISQPSVSLAIKELEEKYQTPLFTVKFILQKKLIFYIIIHYRFFHLLKIWKMKCMKIV